MGGISVADLSFTYPGTTSRAVTGMTPDVCFELPNHYGKLTARENLGYFAALREDPQGGTFAGAGLGVSALWLIALLRPTLRTLRRAT